MATNDEGDCWECKTCGQTLTRHHCPTPDIDWHDPQAWIRQMESASNILQRVYAMALQRWNSGESIKTIQEARADIRNAIEAVQSKLSEKEVR